MVTALDNLRHISKTEKTRQYTVIKMYDGGMFGINITVQNIAIIS